MRFSKIVSTMVFLGAMAALAPSAHAQEKMAVGGGYQYAHISFKEGDPVDTNGFFVDFTGGLPQKTGPFSWAWIGELTGNYKDGHAYTYHGGGVGSFEMNQQVKPFIDIQIGGITEGGDGGDSSSAFLFVIGGGAKFPLPGQKFNILLKLDYMRAFYGDDKGGGQNIFRLGIGASLPLPIK